MNYIELIGVPGAGKTTLLRSLKKPEFRPISGHPLWHVGGLHRFQVAPTSGGPRPDPIKEFLIDSWSRGSLLEYPELFSSVLELVSRINSGGRQRAIVLNYWRNRLRTYDSLSRTHSPTTSVIDEGLAQTLLSTLIRIPGLEENDVAAKRQIEAVVRKFPPIDYIVHIQVSAGLVEKRSRRGKHWAPTLTTSRWLSLIVETLRKEGFVVRDIEGDASPSQVHRDFLNTVSR